MKTRLTLIAIGIIYLAGLFYYHRWSEGTILNGGDPFGYYCYLPAVFIHHDLDDLRKSAFVRDFHRDVVRDSSKDVTDLEVYFAGQVPIIKYTCGVAILELPAFLIAHVITRFSGEPADGYTQLYLFALHIWNTLFVLFGLYVLSGFLRRFFNDGVTALLLFSIAIGTNLFYFSIYNLGMSHGYLFALYTLLLYYSVKLYEAPVAKNFILVAITSGLITLIRPNEVICLLIPLFYGFTSFHEWWKRVVGYFRIPGVYLAVIVFIACLSPQLIYWKAFTGHFLYYSYANEGFDFRHPHIIQGLFGYYNGWLAYSPVMLFALMGLPLLLFYRKAFLMPIILFLPLHVYVIYSWWCWYYVNGLGSRPMIETYPLLAIPLGLFFTKATKKPIGRALFTLLITGFLLLEVLFTFRSGNNTLWSEAANRTFYYQTLFKTQLSQSDLYVYDLDERQPVNAFFDKRLSHILFNDTTFNQGDSNFILGRENPLTIYNCKIGEEQIHEGQLIRISLFARNLPPDASLYRCAMVVVQFKRKGQSIKYKQVRIQNKLPDAAPRAIWHFDDYAEGKVVFFISVPEDIRESDEMEVYAFTNGDSRVLLNDISVELWMESANKNSN